MKRMARIGLQDYNSSRSLTLVPGYEANGLEASKLLMEIYCQINNDFLGLVCNL